MTVDTKMLAPEPNQMVTRHVVWCREKGVFTTIYQKEPKDVNPVCPQCYSYAPIGEHENHIPCKEVRP